jgi:hypothetical protein
LFLYKKRINFVFINLIIKTYIMRKFIFLTFLLSYLPFISNGQSDNLMTKRFALAAKDNLLFEPLILKGDKNETILVYVKFINAFKPVKLLTVVLDEKWNKIYEKETAEVDGFKKTIGEMRGKASISMARLQTVDYGNEFGIFYERSKDLLSFTLSKKDYSIKQNKDVEIDTKLPITTFQRDRSIIKAFPFKNQMYVLFAGKEDNELTVATIKKGGSIDYKTIKVPQLKLDKGNGKSKDLEFMKHDEFDWKSDSLITFIFHSDNDSKYFHTILFNVEQMRARVAKYTYPSVGSGKEKDVYRGAFLVDNRVFLSSVTEEKTVVSIKDQSTGVELKSFSFKNADKMPFQNTPIVERSAQYARGNDNPHAVKVEPVKLEKFWKKYGKGGDDGNIGVINVEPVGSIMRLSFGYQDSRFHTFSSTTYPTMALPNGGSANLPSRTSTISQYTEKTSSDCFGYFDKNFEHLPTQKMTPLEQQWETVFQKSAKMKELSLSMTKFTIGGKDGFFYYDREKDELVMVKNK